MLSSRQLPYVLAGVVLMTLQPILVTLSQNGAGKMEYSAISSTLLSETLKIVVSTTMLLSSPTRPSLAFTSELVQYAVPALIYFVNNNLVFAILEHVDATTFQLLSQLKTVFTGLLFRLFLSRTLTIYQYLAIIQLACGTATSQVPLCAGKGGNSSLWGCLLSVISCLLSAFGGIYSEKLLKDKPKDSIHWQNIQLYTWGIAFNLIAAFLQRGRALVTEGFLAGFNNWAWAVVVNNALNGLAISAILKYADNIARVYAHACAMLVTMVVSIFLFDAHPSPQLLIAITIVASSAVQYNIKPATLPDQPHGYQAVPRSESAPKLCPE